MEKFASKRGMMMLLSLFIVAFSGLYVTVGMTRAVTESRMTQLYLSSDAALLAAEAGLDQTIKNLLASPPPPKVDTDTGGGPPFNPNNNNPTLTTLYDWKPVLNKPSLNNSFYWVKAIDMGGGTFKLDVRGISRGTQRHLEAYYSVATGSLPPATIISDGPVTATGEGGGSPIIVSGNIVANHTGANSISLSNIIVTPNTTSSQDGSITLRNAPPNRYSPYAPGIFLNATGAFTGTCIGGLCSRPGVDAKILGYGSINTSPPYDVNLQLRTVIGSQYDPTTKTVTPGVTSATTSAQPTPLSIAKVTTLPPHPPIPALPGFANNCMQHFKFREHNNDLTGTTHLPGGTPGSPLVYCFASFESEVPLSDPTADTPKLVFDGPAVVIVDATADPLSTPPVALHFGKDSVDATQNGDNSYVDYAYDSTAKKYIPTQPEQNLWFIVKGQTQVKVRFSHVAASIYAPEADVTIRSGSGPYTVGGVVVGKTVTLDRQAKIFGNIPTGTPIPIQITKPKILSWRELVP